MTIINAANARQREKLERVRDFFGMSLIECVDSLMKGERYIFVNGKGKELVMDIVGNHVDGGYAAFEFIEPTKDPSDEVKRLKQGLETCRKIFESECMDDAETLVRQVLEGTPVGKVQV